MVRYLYDEPHFLLQQEVSEVGSYFSMIKAIAAGNHKLSAIAAVLEVKSTNLTKYLKTLMDLDIGVSGRCSVQVRFPVLALEKNISWQLKL